ncbi:hypothetical protein HpBGD107_13630 [Helicobacter pylori]
MDLFIILPLILMYSNDTKQKIRIKEKALDEQLRKALESGKDDKKSEQEKPQEAIAQWGVGILVVNGKDFGKVR